MNRLVRAVGDLVEFVVVVGATATTTDHNDIAAAARRLVLAAACLDLLEVFVRGQRVTERVARERHETANANSANAVRVRGLHRSLHLSGGRHHSLGHLWCRALAKRVIVRLHIHLCTYLLI